MTAGFEPLGNDSVAALLFQPGCLFHRRGRRKNLGTGGSLDFGVKLASSLPHPEQVQLSSNHP
jgi:hypothetical protein